MPPGMSTMKHKSRRASQFNSYTALRIVQFTPKHFLLLLFTLSPRHFFYLQHLVPIGIHRYMPPVLVSLSRWIPNHFFTRFSITNTPFSDFWHCTILTSTWAKDTPHTPPEKKNTPNKQDLQRDISFLFVCLFQNLSSYSWGELPCLG